MKPEPNNPDYNPRDFYLLIDKETNMVYETFRTKIAAERYKDKHPLKDVLEIELNPKYQE